MESGEWSVFTLDYFYPAIYKIKCEVIHTFENNISFHINLYHQDKVSRGVGAQAIFYRSAIGCGFDSTRGHETFHIFIS